VRGTKADPIDCARAGSYTKPFQTEVA
jgi:hypothetical protein